VIYLTCLPRSRLLACCAAGSLASVPDCESIKVEVYFVAVLEGRFTVALDGRFTVALDGRFTVALDGRFTVALEGRFTVVLDDRFTASSLSKVRMIGAPAPFRRISSCPARSFSLFLCNRLCAAAVAFSTSATEVSESNISISGFPRSCSCFHSEHRMRLDVKNTVREVFVSLHSTAAVRPFRPTEALLLSNLSGGTLGRAGSSSQSSRAAARSGRWARGFTLRAESLTAEGLTAEGFTAEGFTAEGFTAEGFTAEGLSAGGLAFTRDRAADELRLDERFLVLGLSERVLYDSSHSSSAGVRTLPSAMPLHHDFTKN
jgi:hypothetical protein